MLVFSDLLSPHLFFKIAPALVWGGFGVDRPQILLTSRWSLTGLTVVWLEVPSSVSMPGVCGGVVVS